ncbi:hypothetical protein HNR23_004078 [Nocardiopsis mwathae]|uniref:Uncharacterized protein n=1 Tax=Nocardiopsis mwathae TaxID=1472723 RepID=A0A7X0D731_9ACTN|nr:hypothetical protein [Nocardiopsis mwathae]
MERTHGVTLYVIAKQDDGWKIVVGQNTAVEASSA